MEFLNENDICSFVTDFEFKQDRNIIENKIKKRPIRISTLLRVFKTRINECTTHNAHFNQTFFDSLDILFEMLNSNSKCSPWNKLDVSQLTKRLEAVLKNNFGSLGETFLNYGLLNSSNTPISFPETLEMIKIEEYKELVNKKTSYKYFWLPVNIALSLAGISESVKSLTKNVMLELGFFYDVHLSFYNIFFDENNEKEVEDNSNNLSWFLIKAYEKSLPHQKRELEKLYFNKQLNSECKSQLIGIFHKLDIPSDFMDYEAKTFDSILDMINNLPNLIPKQLFSEILLKISNKNEIGIGELIFQ